MRMGMRHFFCGWQLLLLGFLVQPLLAQNRAEVGALGTFTFYRSVDVASSTGSGTVGPQIGPGGGFVLGQNMGNRWGGEIRYLYFRNDLQVESGSQDAQLGAQSHAVHYDVLYYFSDPDVAVRPYVAAGFGLKHYQGTGAETPFQPLSNLALLTRTSEMLPAGDFGAGVKLRFGNNMTFRVEFRDYITGVPKKVIAAAPGADLDGILHQFVPIFGLSWTF